MIINKIVVVQVRRLEAAIRKESKQLTDLSVTGGDSDSKKRLRDSENGDYSEGSDKIMAVDKFRSMGIEQLREQATILGISAAGSKKELLQRLCASSEEFNDILQGISIYLLINNSNSNKYSLYSKH